jgi:transcriptional antiterminator RfaH
MPLDAAATTRVATHQPDPRCYSIRWACVYTQPQAEHWAEANLRTAGYRVWFPTHIVLRHDRVTPTIRHPVITPLFPRYGFIAFDHRDTSWSPIRNTPGVVDLVRCGTLPAYTNAAAVERLQAVQALAATQQPKTSQWAPGDAVAPATGAFTGHQAVILSVERDIAQISLLLFGELRTVTISVECLVPRDA